MSAPLRRFCADIPGVGLRRKNTKKYYGKFLFAKNNKNFCFQLFLLFQRDNCSA